MALCASQMPVGLRILYLFLLVGTFFLDIRVVPSLVVSRVEFRHFSVFLGWLEGFSDFLEFSIC